MNYYPHHIGDFDRATRHLTRTERSIYRDLLDVYYDTEAPLTLDQAVLCRKVIARSPEEVDAVRAVLAEFFHETPNGWYHDRCEQELEAYRKTNTQKSAAGKASAAAKAARREQAINGISTPVERLFNGTSTNQEPRTNNQEPELLLVQPDGSTVGNSSLSKKKPAPSDDDLKAARFLYDCNTKVNPSARAPNWPSWGNEIRLMREINGRTHREICALYQWAKADKFWSPNVQGPAKLREKWDQLTEKRIAAAPVVVELKKDWI